MKSTDFTYELMKPDDAQKVFDLVSISFEKFVRCDLTEDGVDEFFRASRKFIFERPENHILYIVRTGDKIAGMIDVRDQRHICLFFVSSEFQGKGLGRGLLKCVLDCVKDGILSVNSSVFAVAVYKKLGFEQLKPVQILNGIKYVPMEKKIKC